MRHPNPNTATDPRTHHLAKHAPKPPPSPDDVEDVQVSSIQRNLNIFVASAVSGSCGTPLCRPNVYVIPTRRTAVRDARGGIFVLARKPWTPYPLARD